MSHPLIEIDKNFHISKDFVHFKGSDKSINHITVFKTRLTLFQRASIFYLK